MDVFSNILAILATVAGFAVVIGLVRPGFVVFWTDRKSRSAVAKSWGVLLVLSAIGYFITAGSKDNFNKYGQNNRMESHNTTDR